LFNPHLGQLSGLLPSGFLTKILYAFLISPMCTTCLANTHELQVNLGNISVFAYLVD